MQADKWRSFAFGADSVWDLDQTEVSLDGGHLKSWKMLRDCPRRKQNFINRLKCVPQSRRNIIRSNKEGAYGSTVFME